MENLNIFSRRIGQLGRNLKRAKRYFRPATSHHSKFQARRAKRLAVKIEDQVRKIVSFDDEWFGFGLVNLYFARKWVSYFEYRPNIFETALKALNAVEKLFEIHQGERSLEKKEQLKPLRLILAQKSAEYVYQNLLRKGESENEDDAKELYHDWSDLEETVRKLLEEQKDPEYRKWLEKLTEKVSKEAVRAMADYRLIYGGPLKDADEQYAFLCGRFCGSPFIV